MIYIHVYDCALKTVKEVEDFLREKGIGIQFCKVNTKMRHEALYGGHVIIEGRTSDITVLIKLITKDTAKVRFCACSLPESQKIIARLGECLPESSWPQD